MFANKLKMLRKNKKLTQSELAKLCGISRNSIVNWETGRSTPKIGDIQRISVIFGISPSELMEGSPKIQEESMPGQSNNNPKGFAYWGGVVDEARRAVERGDKVEISFIEPLLRLAYEMLSSGTGEQRQDKAESVVSGVSAYNGNHSSYTGNSLTVATA